MPEPTLGTLVSWKQDKAYGFIRPADGGKDVFVHLRDFGNIARAPKVGDRIRYQRLSDGAGRYRAADVQVEGMQRTATSRQSRPARRRPASPTVKSAELSATAGLVAGAGIACLLIALCVFTRLPLAVLLLYMVMSLVTFLIYAFDKAAAMNRRWRSRESTLLLAGLAGGGLAPWLRNACSGTSRGRSRFRRRIGSLWLQTARCWSGPAQRAARPPFAS